MYDSDFEKLYDRYLNTRKEQETLTNPFHSEYTAESIASESAYRNTDPLINTQRTPFSFDNRDDRDDRDRDNRGRDDRGRDNRGRDNRGMDNRNQFAPSSMPRTAPPNFIPPRPLQLFRIDASSIRNCLFRFTYVWQDNGDEYWMFPIQVGRNSVSGFRWNRRFGWTFFGVSLNRIDAFMCH